MELRGDERIGVDIATRVVPDDEDIYVIQPGEGYHLYERFASSNTVFLDFPDLALNFEHRPERRALREQIVRSRAIKEWIDEDKVGPEPSRDVTDYAGTDHGLRLGRYAGAVEALYYDLPAGTIVIVPGPYFDDPVLIGELVGPPQYRSWKALYEGEQLPVRRVRWLRKKTRGGLSLELRSKFGTPNPIMQLERSLREEIVRIAFDQYVFEEEYAARLTTYQADFSTLDDFNIQSFVNYVAGVLAAYELGVRDREISFDEALAYLEQHRDLTPELAQNINSPGFQRLYNSTLAPLVVGVLLTLGTTPATAKEPVRPHITNSAAPRADPCAIQVAERVEGAMRLMKLDDWKRVCERAQRAKAQTGLSTSMKVVEVKEKK